MIEERNDVQEHVGSIRRASHVSAEDRNMPISNADVEVQANTHVSNH